MGEADVELTERFECLNSNYEAARQEWVVHVEHCEDCERSPFACEEGLWLQEAMNTAFNAAKREWDRIKAGT